MEQAIKLQNVTKEYKMYQSPKERLFDMFLPKSYGKTFQALKGISFTAQKGESIGLVGRNGQGKSTLLNIISGVIPETSGTIEVNGKISLLAHALGLKENLTGRENIELKCLMLGFSKKEILAMEPDIIDFAGFESGFIDQPFKKYSSGMRSRLGFAISANTDPDILIIDEALSVGDPIFAKKCYEKIQEFKQRGKTFLFVSHADNQIKQFCDKVLWIEGGQVKAFGETAEIMEQYNAFLKSYGKKK